MAIVTKGCDDGHPPRGRWDVATVYAVFMRSGGGWAAIPPFAAASYRAFSVSRRPPGATRFIPRYKSFQNLRHGYWHVAHGMPTRSIELRCGYGCVQSLRLVRGGELPSIPKFNPVLVAVFVSATSLLTDKVSLYIYDLLLLVSR